MQEKTSIWLQKAPHDPVEGLLTSMAEHGLRPDRSKIIPDGDLHRFDVDKRGDDAGWYVIHLDGLPAGAYGNWKADLTKNWCSMERSTMTPDQAEEYRRIVEDARRKRETDKARRYKEAQKRLKSVFDAAGQPDTDHGYLQRKGIKPLGNIRQSGEVLLLPLWDENGEYWNHQEIYPEKRIFKVGTKPRDKNFPPGARKNGLSFTIQGDSRLIICEGYATGASIHQATGATVICAMDAGNLVHVARLVRETCPGQNITICGDDDRWKPGTGNTGKVKATEAGKQINARVLFPVFKDLSTKPTDFNDLASLEGLDAVKKQLHILSENKFNPKTISLDFDPSKIPARDWLVLNSILRGCVSLLVGPGGVSKSIYTLEESMLISGRGPSSVADLIGPVVYRANTLLINNEDDESELKRRIAAIMMVYNISPKDLNNKFFYESGYGAKRLISSETQGGVVIQTPLVDELQEYIKKNEIALMTIDPFVSTHRSNENDNSKIDDVTQIYKGLAANTGCAIRLVHHTRKGTGTDGDKIETSRGGKALSDGCRIGEVLSPLSRGDQALFDLSNDEAKEIVCMENGKANYSKKGAGVYFRLKSIKISNGDWVGVPCRIELKPKEDEQLDRSSSIHHCMAQCVAEKEGLKGGTLPWSEIQSSYMQVSGVLKSRSYDDVTMLPKGRKNAKKTWISDGSGGLSYFFIWYDRSNGKTSRIYVSIEPCEVQKDKKDYDLFPDKNE